MLIDICLSAPSSVLRALSDLEELGFDTTSLIQGDIDETHLLELCKTSHLWRFINAPINDEINTKKNAD